MEALYRFLTVGLFCLSCLATSPSAAQHSVARKWNEALLSAIRIDQPRPTVHARNLFHISVAMYDAWAVYDVQASTYFLNRHFRDYYCPFSGVEIPLNAEAAREEAISYAAYRLLVHRFKKSPGASKSLPAFYTLLNELGYDSSFTSTDYSTGSPAAVGNYIAAKLIEFGLQDGANESNQYKGLHYTPGNPPLIPFRPGNPSLSDPNRWQPFAFSVTTDENGNETLGNITTFLTSEWGQVIPFALKEEDLALRHRDGYDYWVYHDPGPPPFIDPQEMGGLSKEYIWNFALVAIWSCHLDQDDSVMIDISPASNGNITAFPTTVESLQDFYELLDGGDKGQGYSLNPHTGLPYEPQFVRRGDYTRVLAEFWADGPSSETPPGHWFNILNRVSDHPLVQKKFAGEGTVLDDLAWDVKAYLTLGGALHDVAITAWGIKGYYDYVRPVSAIRWMASRGQCTDPDLPSYDSAGLPLYDGFIEIVGEGDALAGTGGENIGKIKMMAWRGPTYIQDPQADQAGVGWILAENWWPYQRPGFVTPPFAGYISGHSAFSRAAAEVLARLTGDEYFPGGVSEFTVSKNEFLVFEEGPSTDLVLQWAKYKDASDQCSLSRIWGGIHPPVDDIPGRLIGKTIGQESFQHAREYFDGRITLVQDDLLSDRVMLYPNPLHHGSALKINLDPAIKDLKVQLLHSTGALLYEKEITNLQEPLLELRMPSVQPGIYLVTVSGKNFRVVRKIMLY